MKSAHHVHQNNKSGDHYSDIDGTDPPCYISIYWWRVHQISTNQFDRKQTQIDEYF